MIRRARSAAAALLLACCAAAAGAQEYEPPAGDEALRAEFWSAIARLERRHRENGEPSGNPSLTEKIRGDVGALEESLQRRALESFLRISHSYRAMQDPRLSQADREEAQNRFRALLEGFSQLAVFEYAERGNPALVQLFSHVRELAVSGPDGLRLSQELARVDPKNALVQIALAKDRIAAGQHAAAVAAAARAVELAPEDPKAFIVLAQSRYAVKDFPGAYESAKRAVALAPSDEMAVSTLKLIRGRVELPGLSEKAMAVAGSPMKPAGAVSGELPEQFSEPPLQQKGGESSRGQMLARGGVPASPEEAVDALSDAQRVLPASILPPSAPLKSFASSEHQKISGSSASAPDGEGGPEGLLARAHWLNRERRHRQALFAAESALAMAAGGEARVRALVQGAWALAGLGRRNEALFTFARAAGLKNDYAPLLAKAAELPFESDLAAFFAEAAELGGSAPPARTKPSAGRRILILSAACAVASAFLLMRALLWMALRRRRSPPRKLEPSSPRFPRALEVLHARGDAYSGPIYDAFDHSLQRRVTLKRLHSGSTGLESARRRALREATLAAGLLHPNIVRIYSIINREQDIWVVLERVEGNSLAQTLALLGKLPISEAAWVCGAVAEALDYAHARGIVHGGLSPSSILLPVNGAPMVSDFVAAGSADVGRYKAPELEEGRFGPESDVFSLGACLQEMLCGEPAFAGSGVELLLDKIHGRHRPAAERLGPDMASVSAVLSKALDPDPRRRWSTTGELAAALRSASLLRSCAARSER